MRRVLIFLTLIAFVSAVNAQDAPVLITGLTELESSDLVTGFSGAGWSVVIDGDYSVMESSEVGDSFVFEVGLGDQLILYRELLSAGGGEMEICVDSLCGSFSSVSTIDQRGAMLALEAADGTSVSIENLDGGLIRLDAILILDAPELNPLVIDPTVELSVLPGGEVVGIDRVIDGAQVWQLALQGANLALLIALIVVTAWKK